MTTWTPTRWSQVHAAAGSDDAAARAALAWLCERAWEPLRRAAIRRGASAERAEDLVQDFCCRLIERRIDLAALAPQHGRCRAWLLTAFQRCAIDAWRREQVAAAGAPAMEPTGEDADPDFDRDWAQALLARARQRLDQEAPERCAALGAFLLRSGSAAEHAAAGAALGLGEGAVKVAVHRLRTRLRELIRQEIAETLRTPSPAAIADELAALERSLRVTGAAAVRRDGGAAP